MTKYMKSRLKEALSVQGQNVKRSGLLVVRWRGPICYVAYNLLTKEELSYVISLKEE